MTYKACWRCRRVPQRTQKIVEKAFKERGSIMTAFTLKSLPKLLQSSLILTSCVGCGQSSEVISWWEERKCSAVQPLILMRVREILKTLCNQAAIYFFYPLFRAGSRRRYHSVRGGPHHGHTGLLLQHKNKHSNTSVLNFSEIFI